MNELEPIRASIRAMEKRMGNHEIELAVTKANFAAAQQQLHELSDHIKWQSRIIIGAVVLGVMDMLILDGGVLGG